MSTMQISVDLAKSVFQVAVSGAPGRVDAEHRLSRAGLVRFFAEREPVEVLIEACGTAHYWGRELEALGHRVSLLPAAAVSRYRSGSKTDRADAKALLEASRNRAICRVPVKTEEQQAVVALHRLRSGYLSTRTARINEVRGHLREFGVSIPLGARRVGPLARAALEDGLVPAILCGARREALEEIEALEEKAGSIQRELGRLSEHMPAAQHLMTVPGIGVLTATALVAFVGDPHRFRSGRRFAAYLGLTPREHSSGRVRRLGRITKHGNSYLRMLMIHGARSVLRTAGNHDDHLRRWALELKSRKGYNVAAVALANRLARISWRVWCDERPFEERAAAA